MAPSALRASAARIQTAAAITAAALALPTAVASLFAGPGTAPALVVAALVLFTGAGVLGLTAVMTRYSGLLFLSGLLAAAAAIAGLFRALELWPVPTLTTLATIAAAAVMVAVARRIARVGLTAWFAGVGTFGREMAHGLVEVAPVVVFLSALTAVGGGIEMIATERAPQDPDLVPLVAGSIIVALGAMAVSGWRRRNI